MRNDETRSIYLAYGSNLHPGRLRRRVPSARVIRPVELFGERLAWHKLGADGSGKCDLVRTEQPADVAHVVAYSILVSESELLDHAEGVGFGYEIADLSVPRLGPAFLYRATPPHIDTTLLPYTWYRDLTLAGARHHGLPPAWVEKIEGMTTTEDPDRDRDARHREILLDL